MRLVGWALLVLGVCVAAASLAVWGAAASLWRQQVTSALSDFALLHNDTASECLLTVGSVVQGTGAAIDQALGTDLLAGAAPGPQTAQDVAALTAALLNLTANLSAIAAHTINRAAYIGDPALESEGTLSVASTAVLAQSRVILQSLMAQYSLVVRQPATLYSLYDLLPLGPNRTAGAAAPGDCALLALLCTAGASLGGGATALLGTAAGILYACDGATATLAAPDADGVLTLRSWDLATSAAASGPVEVRWQRACLTDPPAQRVLPGGCRGPLSCTGPCGDDPRCQPWYSPLANASSSTAQIRVTDPYVDFFSGSPVVTFSFPLLPPSAPSPAVAIAVAGATLPLPRLDPIVATLPSPPVARVVVALGGPYLPILADTLGDPGQPHRLTPSPFSCSNSYFYNPCDTALQGLGQWLLPNRTLIANLTATFVAQDGLSWDVLPLTAEGVALVVAVASNRSSLDAAVAQEAEDLKAAAAQIASAQLAVERAILALQEQALGEVLGSWLTLSQNIGDLQAAARTTLQGTQSNASARMRRLSAGQAEALRRLQAQRAGSSSAALATTFGVAAAAVLAAMACGACALYALHRSLAAAVEVLSHLGAGGAEIPKVPARSRITELDRIHGLCGELAHRLRASNAGAPTLFDIVQKMSPRTGDGDVWSGTGTHSRLPSPHSLRPDSVDSRCHRFSSFGPANVLPFVGSPCTSVYSSSPSTFMARRHAAVLVVNILNFAGTLAAAAEGRLEALLSHYVTAVHDAAVKAKGRMDTVFGDQITVSFNAHCACADPASAAAGAAVDLHTQLSRRLAAWARVQIGMSAGTVYYGLCGYSGFKTKVAAGPPIKVAGLLAHALRLDDCGVLADPAVEERVRHAFALRPVDLVHTPAAAAAALTRPGPAPPGGIIVYSIQGRCDPCHEWLYQVSPLPTPGDWEQTFRRMVGAESPGAAVAHLDEYLGRHPLDRLAKRLRPRVARWTPGLGIRLCESSEHPEGPSVRDRLRAFSPASSVMS